MNRKGLEEKRNDLKAQMSALLETAKAEQRAMTETEISSFDELEKEIKSIDETIKREEKKTAMENGRPETLRFGKLSSRNTPPMTATMT